MKLNVKDKHIGILGAGLAGSLLAKMLRQVGFDVSVFEKRSDPRTAKNTEGRSINLALSHRGIRALEAAGAYDDIADQLIPMKGRLMHGIDGNMTIQPYGKQGQFINSVSRSELNKALISGAESAGTKFYFEQRCTGTDLSKTEIRLEENGSIKKRSLDGLIGADGAFSVMRKALLARDRFNYQQQYIGHGYKELSMPPINDDFAMEPNYLHIWPRGQFMLIALPNPDKTFTCTLFLAFEGEVAFEHLKTHRDVEDFFASYFPDAADLIPDLTGQFEQNPTSSLVTVRCDPWYYQDAMIIGDAAHAIVPFYGQGMNAAFEDVRLFTEMGVEMGFKWRELLASFYRSRKKDADAIASLALHNFIEMRDAVADERFLQRKAVDAMMHEEFGERWIPMYTMVTFSDIPYSEALNRGTLQEDLLINAQKNEYLDDLDRIMADLKAFEDHDV